MPYLTPEIAPPDSNCRRLFVPNDGFMIAAILGQLLELTEAHNWEQTSGISVADTIDIWADIYLEFSQGTFCMIGSIVAILNDSTPSHMLLCDGSNFAKVDYPELYDVLPAVLIVDPATGSVPDLRETFVLAAGTTILEHDTGGSDTHTLTEAEMPAHKHWYDRPTFNVDVESVGIPDPTGLGLPFIPTLSGATGGGQNHENMPPYYALKYAVVAR